jgi:salicylate hydroxylase
MAVEDGAVLGKLLGRLDRSIKVGSGGTHQVAEILQLYESLRKSRTTLNVKGAISNQYWYHLPDGLEQEDRDASLETGQWGKRVKWNLNDMDYQKNLLGFDVIKDCEEAFENWALKDEKVS